jgi:hypothetical protein
VNRWRSNDGYALLATLVVTGVAAVFAAMCVSAVRARQVVFAADTAGARAQAVLTQGLDDTCNRLRWAPSATAGSVDVPSVPPGDGAWHSTWTSVDTPSPGGFPVVNVIVESSAGAARARLTADVELRAEACAQGIVVGEDADLDAPFTVTGSGVYCGGCLRGREWLHLGDGDAGAGTGVPASDCVHGDIWPVAGVHALGSIWAIGEEIHTSPTGGPWSADSDTHTGETNVGSLVSPPDPVLVRALHEHAVPLGDALDDGVLDLSRLPAFPGGEVGMVGSTGGCVVAVRPVGEGGLRIVGERAAADCPLTLVVDGDATVGLPEATTAMRGALVVVGSLAVRGPLRVEGQLYALRLATEASVRVDVPTDWRQNLLAGLATPVLVGLAGP